MPLNLPCPTCAAKIPLSEPFPLPGASVRCTACGTGLAVTYPDGVLDQLRQRGKRFEGEPRRRIPAAPPPPPPGPGARRAPATAPPEPAPVKAAPAKPARIEAAPARPAPEAAPPKSYPSPPTAATEVFPADAPGEPVPTAVDAAFRTEVDRTEVAGSDVEEEYFDRTVPSARSPFGELAVPEPGSLSGGPEPTQPNRAVIEPAGVEATVTKKKSGKKRGCMGCLGGFGSLGCGSIVGVALLGLAALAGGHWYFSQDLPTIETLREYEPATVTTVHAKDGRLLGEIYEQRRYVRPLSELPKHVTQAFIAAEDATFYEHGGVNYWGLVRAVGRSISTGRSPKGTSTITQQVAKNFLLSNEHSLTRKIREAILAGRIEEAYDKDHILFLYVNEIYLGSQAYGVEAAARTYFGKGAHELTHGEAALLAGLPPRPSGYSPHKSWKLARDRQAYVIEQMVEKEFLTAAEGKAALAESITVIARGNTFLEQAPHFTEHARRFLVDTYGEDKVLNQGLSVTTTCDLDLQRIGQEAVTKGIFEVDQRMGFRRNALEGTVDAAGIEKVRAEHELAMKTAQALARDAAKGRSTLPEKSTLEANSVYKAVILEVDKRWVRVGIGSHEAIIPLAWTDWAYQPNPSRSWRHRNQDDLTTTYDWDDDGTKDDPVLKKGDLILARVRSLDTQKSPDKDLDKTLAKVFKDTPGASKSLVAAQLWQVPEVEGALLSMDLATGAIITMVGGADFTRSQLNRTVQSRRQVGSTFKPFVYAAAIERKTVTAATIVPDAPYAKSGGGDIWKPANYANDYMGNITLRKALAMSRNTCTIRVLDATDPGMAEDVFYEFGRRLGIGGVPTYRVPPGQKVAPENDQLCPWVEVAEGYGCKDTVPAPGKPGRILCRSCDLSMALGSASITMEEMVRAYSAFGTGGLLREPYYVTEVKDRDNKVLYTHEEKPSHRVLEPEVAAITTWLLQNVVQGGTASAANKLGLNALAGKTGTTNDEKDAWFIGYTNDVITAVWVGFDQPASLGVSSTGGRTALPIWMDFMEAAAPKSKDRAFPMWGDVQSAMIDEESGRRVDSGGRAYPFLPGTVPESTGTKAGQLTAQDMLTEL